MAKHASLEVAEASVKIIGNPRLYSSVMATTHPANLGKQPKLDPTPPDKPGAPTDTPTLEYSDFKYWSQLPALAVINIKMPAHNDDVALMGGTNPIDGSRSPDYTKNFWYEGYYYVYGIEHSFDGGEFTQQLMMVAMPNGSLLEKGNLKTENEQAAKNVVDCYTSMVKDNPPSDKVIPPTPTVPHAPDVTKKEVEPTNKQDADTMNATAVGDPSKIRGWTAATPAVQQAINEASARTGVDSSLLAQFALIESSYNPTAKAKTSSATGLYQHIDGTWMGLVRENRIPGVNPNMPTAEALALRTNPLYSALGGAAYLQQNAKTIKSNNPGDLYLAHFSGPGSAKRIIRACDSGNGGQSLEEVLGVKTATRMKNANPQLRSMDAAGLRAWAAKKISGTMVNGVPTATAVAVPPPKVEARANPRPQAARPPEPIKGKTPAERVAEITKKTAPGKPDAPKSPCGTTEPARENLAILSYGP
jgi:hypothetical protein